MGNKETVGCVRIGLEGLRRITEFKVSLWAKVTLSQKTKTKKWSRIGIVAFLKKQG